MSLLDLPNKTYDVVSPFRLLRPVSSTEVIANDNLETSSFRKKGMLKWRVLKIYVYISKAVCPQPVD